MGLTYGGAICHDPSQQKYTDSRRGGCYSRRSSRLYVRRIQDDITSTSSRACDSTSTSSRACDNTDALALAPYNAVARANTEVASAQGAIW